MEKRLFGRPHKQQQQQQQQQEAAAALQQQHLHFAQKEVTASAQS